MRELTPPHITNTITINKKKCAHTTAEQALTVTNHGRAGIDSEKRGVKDPVVLPSRLIDQLLPNQRNELWVEQTLSNGGRVDFPTEVVKTGKSAHIPTRKEKKWSKAAWLLSLLCSIHSISSRQETNTKTSHGSVRMNQHSKRFVTLVYTTTNQRKNI